MNYKKNPNELEEEYIYRICSNKDAIGSWYEVADIINKELGYEYTESKYRKQYQAFEKMLDANREVIMPEGADIRGIREALDELYKAKVQVRDQRREYRKDLSADARFEHLCDCLREATERLNTDRPLVIPENTKICGDGKSAVLVISDIHYGMVTDNIWNTYNTEIAKKRLGELVQKSKEYISHNGVSELNIILLGDCAHGAIHTSARVRSEEDTCDQLMEISEILANVISHLANSVGKTNVYSTYGNHMRTVQNYKDSVHSDNMEKIIPWFLKQRLRDRADIEIYDNEFYEFIHINVLGSNIVATHGDLDSFRQFGVTANALFTQMYGVPIDYTISADKHHMEEFEQFGIESTLVRSLCGTDDYANDHRLYSKAGQTLMIFNEHGKECTYNITFSV